MNGTGSLWRRVALGAPAVLLILAAGGAAAPGAHPRVAGGVATFALPPGELPNFISPYINGPESNNVDLFQFENQLWRPLYWYGINGEFTINYHLSVGRPPVYSNHGRTVTITLNHYLWSDGRPVTNRDIELWMNLLRAEPAQWVGYVPGNIPDTLTGMSFPKSRPYQFSLTFNKAYSPTWILYQELSSIEPIPQHVWDRTSMRGPVGNYDMTRAGAIAVWKFLTAQSKDAATYASNPLWRVVDGPWKLSAYEPATGYAAFVPNRRYVGPQKPTLSKFELVPFTSDTAEFDALRAGQLSYGYLPSQDLAQRRFFTSRGYRAVPWVDWGFNSFAANFSNPKVGRIFDQLYVRQAMQHLIDQPAIISHIYHGDAYPTYGPVPLIPKSPFLSRAESRNPYPYSPTAARRLLSSHGWSIHPSGTDTCLRPGTAPDDCGAGIPRGARLSFTMETTSGSVAFTAETEAIQSDWSLAGIHLLLTSETVGAIIPTLVPCNRRTGLGCSWELANVGEPGTTGTYSPQYLPTMAMWIAAGGGNNAGDYNNPELNRLLDAISVDPHVSAFFSYENYVSTQLPNFWQPNYYYQTSVIAPTLRGVTPQDPNLNIYPQDWSFTR